MLMCKHPYDEKKKSDPGNENYLNLIIDEAHNIYSLNSTRESEAWQSALDDPPDSKPYHA